eukprot:570213-Prymnesium_polylepis.1
MPEREHVPLEACLDRKEVHFDIHRTGPHSSCLTASAREPLREQVRAHVLSTRGHASTAVGRQYSVSLKTTELFAQERQATRPVATQVTTLRAPGRPPWHPRTHT